MRRVFFQLRCGLVALSAGVLVGCSSTTRVFSADYVGDRQVSLDWVVGDRIDRSRWDPESTGGVPPLSSELAVAAASEVLADYVRQPGEWPLASCELVELKAGCYGYAVVFKRNPGFEDNHAGDALVYLYVLFDGSVVAPVVTYSR